jgi:FK506-binding protein 1
MISFFLPYRVSHHIIDLPCLYYLPYLFQLLFKHNTTPGPRLDGSSPQTPETLNPSEDSTTLREWSDARQKNGGGGVFVSSSKNKNVLQNDPNTIGNQLTQSNGNSGNRDLDTDDDVDDDSAFDDDDTFNDDSAFDDDDDDAFNFLINNPLTNAPTAATVATNAPTAATVTTGTGTTGSDDFIDVSLAQDGGIMKQILTVAPIGAPSPTTNDSVTADYVGTLVSSGNKFDSSIDRGQPFTFIIGQGNVIRGWDEGFLSMKIGEKALLKLRSDYAYGVRGSPPKIPSSSDLYFEVELIDINSSRGRFDNVSRKLSDLIHHHDNDNRVLEPIEEGKTSSSSSSSLLSSSAKTNKNTICNCVANGILSVWDYDLQLLEDDDDIMATINEKYGSRDDLDAVLGNPIFDENDVLISADAIKVTYFLKDRSYVIKGETMDPINEQWEEDVFLYNTNNANDNTTTYPTIKVDYFSSRSIKDEFGGRLADDIRFVIVSYFVAFLFVATTIGSRLQCNGPGSRWYVFFNFRSFVLSFVLSFFLSISITRNILPTPLTTLSFLISFSLSLFQDCIIRCIRDCRIEYNCRIRFIECIWISIRSGTCKFTIYFVRNWCR